MDSTKDPDRGKPFFYKSRLDRIRASFIESKVLRQGDVEQFDETYRVNLAEAAEMYGEQESRGLWHADFQTFRWQAAKGGVNMTIAEFTKIPPAMSQAQLEARKAKNAQMAKERLTVPVPEKTTEAASESSKSRAAAPSGVMQQPESSESTGQASNAIAQLSQLTYEFHNWETENPQVTWDIPQLDTWEAGNSFPT